MVGHLAELKRELADLRHMTLAESTQHAYASYRRSYEQFCSQYKLCMVPCSPEQMCLYITFLARSLQYTSIQKYIGIVRMLYVEAGMEDPKLTSVYEVKRTLQAVKRRKGCEPLRRTPILPDLLEKMYTHLDMGLLDDASFWAICLVAFFGLLRISNVIPKHQEKWDKERILTRAMFESTDTGMVLKLTWAKNNQYQERVVPVPLPFLRGHSMCPVTSVYLAFIMSPDWDDESPAFVRGPVGRRRPIIYGWFMRKLRSVLQKCGVDSTGYGSHSFRRGGASWALKCGVSGELVRILGDWKSDAYRAYLEVPIQDKLALVQQLAEQVRAQVAP